jgi:hypothetical protein
MEKELVLVREAAKMLRVSQITIIRRIKDGRLLTACPNGPGKKPVFVLRSSIENYLQSIKISPEAWSE